jgi:hypothetical protein
MCILLPSCARVMHCLMMNSVTREGVASHRMQMIPKIMILLLLLFSWSRPAWAQGSFAPDSASLAPLQQQPPVPCIQPPPVVSWRDYRGPFAKVIGTFTGRLERKSVREPHYKPGARLCTLVLKDKFILFVEDTVDPASFIDAGYNAGISQAEDDDASFGQGAAGYGKRFGASLANQASAEFFADFAYPTIFSEDPRYYRLGRGSFKKRLFHAMSHSVVAYRENGKRMFNFSQWLGSSSAVALSNVYTPDNRRGFAPAAERVTYGVANNIGFDVLREFWPEIARKFRLPFRYETTPPQ